MTKVKLVNEDGVIKGVDPRTGQDVPIEFEDISAEEITAAALSNSSHFERPLWSTESRSIVYGSDVTSPEELIGELPWLLFHEYEVDLSAVSDPNLDLRIPQTLAATVGAGTREGPGLIIEGAENGVGGPDIGSCYIEGFVGGVARLKGVTLNKSNPFDDEGAAFVAKNSRVDAARCKIGSSIEPRENGYTVGFQSYASHIQIFECDLGDRNVDFGLMAKKAGEIYEQLSVPVPLTGTAKEYAYLGADNGFIGFTSEKSTASGDSGLVRANKGMVHEVNNNRLYGVREIMADTYEDYYDEMEIKLGGSRESGPQAILRNNGDLDLAGTVNENAL